MNKKLCFVDENLQIVTSFEKAKAFVNLLRGYRVEILFLLPIAHNLNKIEAFAMAQKINYIGQKVLPNHETCNIINTYFKKNGKSPIITDCHIAYVEEKNPYYRNWNAKMDENGNLQPVNMYTILENVYVALQISLSEFIKLNPNKNFPEDFTTTQNS